MALANWILIAVLLSYTESTSTANPTDGVTTYFLESCTTAIEVKLHKDRPNEIVKIRLFDSFPRDALERSHCGIYVYIEEFFKAWISHTLSQRLSNYKLLVTLEDVNWPDQCDKIFCVVEDMQRNGTTMCTELPENIFNYRFDLNYRRFLPLQDDYSLDMTVAVAYMPYGSDTNGCPSAEFFQCVSDSLCIPSRFWCDKTIHCSDESDELNCEEKRRPPTVVVTSSEEPDLIEPDREPFTSAEDYSSEEDTEVVTMGSKPPGTTSTTSTTAAPKLTTTTTKRPTGAPTTLKPPKTITKATTTKKPVSVTKTTKAPARPPSSSSPPLKASEAVTAATKPLATTKATTAATPISTTASTTSMWTTASSRDDSPSRTESSPASSSSKTTTPPAIATTPRVTTPMAPKSEHSTQALVHFSFTERPSIAIIRKPSDTGLTSVDPFTPESSQDVTSSSTEIPPTTSVTTPARTTTGKRRKEPSDINAASLDDSKDNVYTVSTVDMKYHSGNASAKPPYPWSDRYDSRSRNSSATGTKSAPNQWVLAVLCLILVFIYFFL